VLTTIMSVSSGKDRAMGDAGFKSLGWHPFGGLPIPRDRKDVVVTGLSAEHTKFYPATEGEKIALSRGDKVMLVPGYTDAMGFLHQRIFAIRKDVVTAVWNTISQSNHEN
jgi:3-hydroxy-D-aspartate aldolase